MRKAENDSAQKGKMTNLSKGLFLTLASNFAGLASSLVVVGVGSRMLSKEEMGGFFMAMVVALFAGSIADLGLRNGVIRVLSVSGSMYERSAMPYLVTWGAISSIATCVILAAAASTVAHFSPSSMYVSALSWGGLAAFAMSNWQMAVSVLVGQQRYRELSLLSLAVEALRIVMSLVLILLLGGAGALIMGIVLSRLIGYWLFCARSQGQVFCCFSTRNSKELLRFSAWSYGSAVVSVFTGRLPDFVLNSQFGPAVLATYSTAMQIPLLMNRGYESIRPVVMGYVASRDESANSVVMRGSRTIAGSLAIAALAIMLTADKVVPLIFSVRYVDSVPIAVILSIWVVVGLTNYFVSTALLGAGKSQIVFLFSAIQLPLMALLCATIVPLYGAFGAAESLVLTAIIGNLLYAYTFAENAPEVAAALFRLLPGVHVPLLSFAYAMIAIQLSLPERIAAAAFSIAVMVALKGIDVGEMSIVVGRLMNRRRAR